MIVAARTNDDEFELFASSIAGDWSIGIINNGNGRGEDGDLSTLGGGWNLHTIENIRVVNGELTIGGRGTATKNAAWLSMDEFRLYKMDEVSDDIIIEALTDNLSAYIKEIENALYDIRGNLTSLMINEIGSKITEAKAVVNNASRTADMLNNAYNQLKETYEITVEFSNVSDQLRDLIEEIQGTNLDEIPDSFIDPVGEILRYAEELLEDDSRTYDVLAETYSSLRVAFDRAIAAQGPYAALSIAISDVQTLLDINPNLSESLEYYLSVASNVLDNEDATSEMYVAAKNQLYTRVANLYKGYEKESYIDELENTGCDLIDETSIPDYWKIDKGVGNTYTNTGQHYSVLLYEEGTDEYEDAKANRYLDSWNGTAGAMVYKAEQTVVLGEKGLYILRAAARSTGTGAYIFAGDNQTEITVSGDQGGELGYGWNIIEVPFVITDANADQKITIGVKTTEGWGGTWFSADDFDLDYYPGFDPTTGIGSVEVSNVKVYCRDGYIVVEIGRAHV